jgi:hypothetical protein
MRRASLRDGRGGLAVYGSEEFQGPYELLLLVTKASEMLDNS